jgi:hypothetical protein
MKTSTTHSNGVSILLVAVAISVSVLLSILSTAARPATAAAASSVRPYGWPVAPFDVQHPVRGVLGDPRTVYHGPPTRTTLYHGSGSFSFHMGVDICAPDGTPVYAVADGAVSNLNSEKVVVDSGGGNRFEYWHIRPAVHKGQHVTARRTVLGRILRGAGHVHLTEISAGTVTNPLLPGHLTPYNDKTAPSVGSIRFQSSDESAPILANFVRGRVGVIVEAYDTPSLPVRGEWRDMPVTPSRLSWRVETWNGKVVIPEAIGWDVRSTIPSNADFWKHYAHGTYQNMAVFAPHFSWGQPGSYLFRLATLDTRRLTDNVYRLVVTASDIRGNHATSAVRFSVHNDPGWVGV